MRGVLDVFLLKTGVNAFVLIDLQDTHYSKSFNKKLG